MYLSIHRLLAYPGINFTGRATSDHSLMSQPLQNQTLAVRIKFSGVHNLFVYNDRFKGKLLCCNYSLVWFELSMPSQTCPPNPNLPSISNAVMPQFKDRVEWCVVAHKTECSEYIQIFEYSNISPTSIYSVILQTNFWIQIYSDIRSCQDFDSNIF